MQKTTTEAGDGKQRAEGLLVRHEAGAEIVEDTPNEYWYFDKYLPRVYRWKSKPSTEW